MVALKLHNTIFEVTLKLICYQFCTKSDAEWMKQHEDIINFSLYIT